MLIKQVDFCLNIRISFSSKGFVLGLLMFFFSYSICYRLDKHSCGSNGKNI